MYILIVTFVGTKQEDNRFWAEWWQVFPNFNQFLIPRCMQFLFVRVASKNSDSSKCSNKFISYPHVILSYSMLARHEHILSFLIIYF